MIDTFEQLSQLANSPEEFAALRAQLIAKAVGSGSNDTQTSIDLQHWAVGVGLHSAETMMETLQHQAAILDNLSKLLMQLVEDEVKKNSMAPRKTSH